MQLLREFQELSYDVDDVKRTREKTGKIVLKGILQRADTLNQNGRIYPRPILERELRNYQDLIGSRRALGELDHPADSVVNLQKVSHLVTGAQFEGDTVYGTIEILDTPMGKIAQQLVEAGVTLGISSRAVGSTRRQNDSDVVADDMVLLAFDLVSTPSTPNAYLFKEAREIDHDELRRALSRQDRIARLANTIIDWKGCVK